MKVCAVQTRPVNGDIPGNIAQHQRLLEQAAHIGASLVIFPELSLTGYMPALAQALATTPDDPRLEVFQTISDARQLTIGVGLPIKSEAGIYIGMVLFAPDQERRIYAKQYLYRDEEPFFVPGPNITGLVVCGVPVALAICYELSVPAHTEQAFQHGAGLYIASVAKSRPGVAQATQRLAAIARQYAVPVLMANCVGPAEQYECAGQSAVWDSRGVLIGQLDAIQEGMILYDTEEQSAGCRPAGQQDAGTPFLGS